MSSNNQDAHRGYCTNFDKRDVVVLGLGERVGAFRLAAGPSELGIGQRLDIAFPNNPVDGSLVMR
jgi:hypothetical protein